jgi:hypothetical protein
VALVKCPKCRAHLDLDDEHLGREVDCGSCGAVFVARTEGIAPLPPGDESEDEDFSLPPSRSRSRYDDDYDDDDYDLPPRRRRRRRSGVPDLEYARSLVRPAAIAMLVAAVISLVYRSFGLLLNLGFGVAMMQGAFPGPGGPGGPPGGPNNQAAMAGQMAAGVAVDVYTICLSVLIIVGCVRMMKLKGYGLAITACILSMINCFGCCLIGLPFGIWTLVMLLKPEVRDAFRWLVTGTRDAE